MPVRFAFATLLVSFVLVMAGVSRGAESVPVPVQGGAATLTPQNTKLQFVCAHVGARPDPRKGGFAKFMGKAEIDPATKTLQGLDVDIDTTSLFTEFDMLTNHLKSPDFFEVRRFPTGTSKRPRLSPALPARVKSPAS